MKHRLATENAKSTKKERHELRELSRTDVRREGRTIREKPGRQKNGGRKRKTETGQRSTTNQPQRMQRTQRKRDTNCRNPQELTQPGGKRQNHGGSRNNPGVSRAHWSIALQRRTTDRRLSDQEQGMLWFGKFVF